MLRPGRLLFLLTGLALAVHAASPNWPQAASDLAADPDLRFGTLPNGLRYAVQSHPEPRGRVALRLLVLAGSLQEAKSERGLAHFVEHVAFTGTRRFPDNTLVDVLQRHGFSFGADVSAFTFPAFTVYQVEAVIDPPDRLNEAFRVLRDFADGITFDPAQIDRERKVVQSERRARDNWQSRAYDARQRFLLPGNLHSERNPIGDEEVVRTAGAAELRQFYAKWYRADNLCVIAIGDLPADKLEEQVRAEFGSMAAPAAPLPATPDPGPIGNPKEVATYLHSDTAAGAVSVELCSVIAGPGGVETRALREASIRRELVETMLNERLSQIRRDHAEIFGAAVAYNQDAGQLINENTLHIDTSTLMWQEAVATVVREWREAGELGFSPEEIANAARIFRRRYEYGIAAFPTEPSRNLADRLVGLTAEQRVYSSPTQWWEQTEPILASFTPAEAQRVFHTMWEPGSPRLFVAGNLVSYYADKELANAYANGLKRTLNPPPRPQAAVLPYQPAEQPGKIRRRRHDAATDIELVEFANGVRLNLKHTDFNRNLVYLRARVGWGQQAEPLITPGLGLLAAYYVNEAGLARYQGDDLRRYLAQQNLSLGFSIDEDTFRFTGSADARALPEMFTLFSAYLTDLARRPSDLLTVKNRIASIYTDSDHEANSALNAIANRVISGDDARLALPDPLKIRFYPFDTLMTWLEPALRKGPVEIALVGDFDVEQAVALAARTVGTLPGRLDRDSAQHLRPIKFQTKPGRWECPVNSEIPRGAVRAQWPVRGCGEIHVRRQLEILAGILQERVRHEIREKMGATYDPNGNIWSGETLRDDGYLMIQLSALPADARALSQRITALAEDLAQHGATEAEMQAVVQPRLSDNLNRLRDNSYWLYYVLDNAQEEPIRLTWPDTRESDYRKMTLAQINRLAAKYLGAKKAQLFTAVPR